MSLSVWHSKHSASSDPLFISSGPPLRKKAFLENWKEVSRNGVGGKAMEFRNEQIESIGITLLSESHSGIV